MPAYETVPRPDICVCRAASADEVVYRDVCLGMEEEGIPFHDGRETTGDAVALAFAAAGESRLGVGLGIDGSSVVLHFAKLQPDKPLFSVKADADDELLRAIGSNAARLVKKVPFKTI